jgi:hypothetical protein
MIVFVLLINICVGDSIDSCRWRRVQAFVQEENCHELGGYYLHDSDVRQYKCVMMLREYRK